MTNATTSAKLYLGAWAVYPLLVPFYVFGKVPIPGTEKVESGVPQPADYYLVALVGLVFLGLPFRIGRSAAPVVRAFVCFVCYTAVVNFAWSANLEDTSLLKSSLFYSYDVVLFLTCLVLHAAFGERFLKVTVYAVAASVVLQVILSPFAPQQAYARQALFFNNENQLGYYCVLAASLFALGARRFSLPLSHQLVMYGAVGYLAAISQSRSALLALLALATLSMLDRPVRLFLLLGGLAAISVALTERPPVLSKSEERLVVKGEYDTLATRGYDRILNHPEHLLFGAGEGAHERFESDLYASEIHSSYGTLLFCYGVVGAVLFTVGLAHVCAPNPRAVIYLIPAFIHGSAHHGLRFAFFWATLAFIYCAMIQPTAAEGREPSPPAGTEDGPADSREGG
ncbi:MAG: hypothetical protein IT429_12985 [Gemmataceae bacterium]|nr:hypothetical protein [Gemmataceae bacterium]